MVTSDLFFSEYIEGSSNNKALEIYNGTGTNIDLSIYSVKLAANGGNWGNILDLSGFLAAGDVYIIFNSGADSIIKSRGDITSSVTYFNGDDAVGLFKKDTLIDIVGQYMVDPGTAWDVAGIVGATQNTALSKI
jgi:predicted extracellular nuclease